MVLEIKTVLNSVYCTCLAEPLLEEQSGRDRENRLPVSTLVSEDCTSYGPLNERHGCRELSSISDWKIVAYQQKTLDIKRLPRHKH